MLSSVNSSAGVTGLLSVIAASFLLTLFVSRQSKEIRSRIEFKHIDGKRRTSIKKERFPYNITMAKGPVHVLASRAYVEFVIKDPVALEFREWCRDTGHGSEHFFNSLEYSPQLGVPGAFTGRL